MEKLQGRGYSSRPYSARLAGQKLFHSTFRSQASALNLAEKIRIYSPAPTLSRTRSKPILHDKEQLYDETLQLKARNHLLTDDNLKLRTSLIHLQKELTKREETDQLARFPTNTHLVSSLKQAVKDLKTEIRLREDTIEVMKRDMRATHIAELTAHVETLEEECKRLASGVEARLKEDELNKRADWVDELRHENQRLRVEGEKNAAALRETAEELRRTQELLQANKADMKQFAEAKQQHQAVEEIHNKCSQLETALSEAKSIEIALRNQLTALQETHFHVIASSRTLESSLSQEKQANSDLNQQVSSLNSALSEATAAFKAAKSEEMAVVEDIKRIHDEEMKSTKGELERQVEHLKGRLEGQEQAVRAALSTAADLEKQNIQQNSLLERSRDISEALQIQLKEAKDRVETLEKMLIPLRKEADEARNQSLSYGLQLDTQTQIAVNLRSALSGVLAKPISKLAAKAKEAGYTPQSLIARLDPQGQGTISADHLKEGLSEVGIKAKKKHWKALVRLLDSGAGLLSLELLQSYLIKRKSSSSSEDPPAGQMPAIPQTTQGEDAYESSFETPEVAIVGEVLHSEGDPELLIVDGRGLYPVASTQPASPQLEQMLATLLRHVSMRCQLHRVNAANVPELLFGTDKDSEISVREVKARLETPPIELKQEMDLQLLCLMLLGVHINDENLSFEWGNRMLNAKTASERLLQRLGNWEIYTETDEHEFDSLTTAAITRISADFQILCATKDSDHTGSISFEDFYAILQSLDVQFARRHQLYLALLFYSQEQQLDSVPYMVFVNAFVEKEVDTDEILKEMASSLLKGNQHPRDVFLFDMQGLIRLPDLELACQHLHISLPAPALESLLRSLQSPLSSAPCLHIKDLESALEPYGVSIPEYKLTSTGHYGQGSSGKSSCEEVNE